MPSLWNLPELSPKDAVHAAIATGSTPSIRLAVLFLQMTYTVLPHTHHTGATLLEKEKSVSSTRVSFMQAGCRARRQTRSKVILYFECYLLLYSMSLSDVS